VCLTVAAESFLGREARPIGYEKSRWKEERGRRFAVGKWFLRSSRRPAIPTSQVYQVFSLYTPLVRTRPLFSVDLRTIETSQQLNPPRLNRATYLHAPASSQHATTHPTPGGGNLRVHVIHNHEFRVPREREQEYEDGGWWVEKQRGIDDFHPL
jgi:hypothetical protein